MIVTAPWLVAMDWQDALFLHWRVPASALRPLIPRDLDVEETDGSAWIGIVAFRIANARVRGVPAPLGLPAFGEINVRTYVDGGKPGVWFLSLDAASTITVEAGRTALHLPYYRAAIGVDWDERACAYRSERTDPRAPAARFTAAANATGAERTAQPGTVEHALVERYCFYTTGRNGSTLRCDVEHEPWPLRDASATIAENTLLAAVGIALPDAAAAPLAHASRGVSTRAWPLRPR